MTNIAKEFKLNSPKDEKLTFYNQCTFTIVNSYLLLIKISLIIGIVVLFCLPKPNPLVIFEVQTLPQWIYIPYIVILCMLLVLLLFELSRDLYYSRFLRYVDWDKVQISKEGISLDSYGGSETILMNPTDIIKIHLHAKIHWDLSEDSQTKRVVDAMIYFKNKPSEIIYNISQTDGIGYPKSEIQRISNFITTHCNIPAKIKKNPDYSISFLLILCIVLLIATPIVFL